MYFSMVTFYSVFKLLCLIDIQLIIHGHVSLINKWPAGQNDSSTLQLLKVVISLFPLGLQPFHIYLQIPNFLISPETYCVKYENNFL